MKKSIIILLIGIKFIVNSVATETLKNSIQFATLEKATALLNVNDIYTDNWSRFDIDSRVQKTNSTKEEQFKNMTSQLRSWSTDEIKKINKNLEIIDKTIALNEYKLNLPKEIILIKSTLKDEGGADGYTRGNCIILEDKIISLSDADLQKLLIHEVFHILTRYDSVFRKEMYSIIGFNIMNEVAYPQNLKEYKISNPDAPKKDSYITLKKDGIPIECMMILYSDKQYKSGSFFEYLNIGLLKLKGAEKKEIDYNSEGQAIIYKLDEVTDFFEQIGFNTQYIIDPEEALADNFVFAITNKKRLPSPAIVTKIQENLKK
ncbi:MAG: hypothetical protein IPF58_17295 [Saprospirales bacterium]|nr:hypothetical protein [Saprospirales bacterium]